MSRHPKKNHLQDVIVLAIAIGMFGFIIFNLSYSGKQRKNVIIDNIIDKINSGIEGNKKRIESNLKEFGKKHDGIIMNVDRVLAGISILNNIEDVFQIEKGTLENLIFLPPDHNIEDILKWIKKLNNLHLIRNISNPRDLVIAIGEFLNLGKTIEELKQEIKELEGKIKSHEGKKIELDGCIKTSESNKEELLNAEDQIKNEKYVIIKGKNRQIKIEKVNYKYGKIPKEWRTCYNYPVSSKEDQELFTDISEYYKKYHIDKFDREIIKLDAWIKQFKQSKIELDDEIRKSEKEKNLKINREQELALLEKKWLEFRVQAKTEQKIEQYDPFKRVLLELDTEGLKTLKKYYRYRKYNGLSDRSQLDKLDIRNLEKLENQLILNELD